MIHSKIVIKTFTKQCHGDTSPKAGKNLAEDSRLAAIEKAMRSFCHEASFTGSGLGFNYIIPGDPRTNQNKAEDSAAPTAPKQRFRFTFPLSEGLEKQAQHATP